MEDGKRKRWWFVVDATVIVGGAVAMVAVVYHYRKPPPTTDVMVIVFFSVIIFGLLIRGWQRLLRKATQERDETMAWENRTIPPSRNPYWRPKPPNSN